MDEQLIEHHLLSLSLLCHPPSERKRQIIISQIAVTSYLCMGVGTTARWRSRHQRFFAGVLSRWSRACPHPEFAPASGACVLRMCQCVDNDLSDTRYSGPILEASTIASITTSQMRDAGFAVSTNDLLGDGLPHVRSYIMFVRAVSQLICRRFFVSCQRASR